MSVLIAEDDPTSRRVLERAVQSFGHQVVAAADGQQAWEMFTAGDFQFVITDWVMPVCDGLELCRRIRSSVRAGYVYIIMVTSSGGRDDFLTGMDAGVDDFIVKPINPQELMARMRAAERVLKLQRKLHEKNEELEMMNSRLRRLSRLDALTQLGNRVAFEETITDFHHRASRYASPYGIVMCDVDCFKAYNDNHGHLSGDEVLRRVASVLKGCLRASDGGFRYGGDEIAILLAEQTMGESVMIAERLQRAVESLNIPRRGCGADCVTISCGVASCPADSGAVPDWEVVLEWADQALYRAKALGRNRVEMAEACCHLHVA